MTQTTPATCVLGPGKTGLTIGLRVLNLDGTTYAAFATTAVAETSTAGTYRKAGGVVAPLAGGYIVWGTALVDYAEATVDGTAVTLADDAITAAKFDETTAWPLKAADAGATYIARTGADSDTLETISDQLDGINTAGSGAISHTITVDDGVNPLDGAEVWVSTDLAGANVVAGTLSTDALGQVTFLLDAGTYYKHVQLAGYNFTATSFTVA